VPEEETLKTTTSPAQTATGKDLTNPLRADKGLQYTSGSFKAAKSNQERFYVIYKGPRAGIYTNWGEVHKICQEDKSTNKKFSNLEQAQMEFHLHGDRYKMGFKRDEMDSTILKLILHFETNAFQFK
ncbi:Orf y, partial [Tanacetum coccineum]